MRLERAGRCFHSIYSDAGARSPNLACPVPHSCTRSEWREEVAKFRNEEAEWRTRRVRLMEEERKWCATPFASCFGGLCSGVRFAAL